MLLWSRIILKYTIMFNYDFEVSILYYCIFSRELLVAGCAEPVEHGEIVHRQESYLSSWGCRSTRICGAEALIQTLPNLDVYDPCFFNFSLYLSMISSLKEISNLAFSYTNPKLSSWFQRMFSGPLVNRDTMTSPATSPMDAVTQKSFENLPGSVATVGFATVPEKDPRRIIPL